MTRRSFLKSLVAAAALVMLTACFERQVTMTTSTEPDMELVFNPRHEVSEDSSGRLVVDGHEYTQDTIGELLVELKRHSVDVELRKKR